MKQVLVIVLLFSFLPSAFPKKNSEENAYSETYRNQYHFSTRLNKMGAPISIWASDSIYHLYYQYNPFNLIEGFVNWGHATSENLLKWKEEEIVILQPVTVSDSMLQSPWWGSVCSFEDKAFAWVDRWDDGIYQTQSTDGKDWSKEIKTTGVDEFDKSESYVFWYEPDQCWVMIAYDRATKTMNILNSTDGLAWKESSKFKSDFGFPQFMELPVDRKSDDKRWVLITEHGTYMLGDFDGKTFVPEVPLQYFNRGDEIGGSIVFEDSRNERTLVLSQLKSENQADIASNGSMTFPAELSLHEYPTGIEFQQKPIDEIESLYTKESRWEDKKIYPGMNNNLLKKVKGTSLRISGVIDVGNSDQFGFLVRSDRYHKGNEIVFNMKKGLLNYLNNEYKYQADKKKVNFELLIDRSAVELYLDEGRYVFSTSYSPIPTSLNYELFTIGGDITVEWMEVQVLSSIWSE
jgi:sucrose-6-phosphate hydrolase SacC (GH32 family)